ncbi:sensor domain-containing diguanylate cyclase [Pseudomonas sp. URIL14HWK12:I5]|uniref:GGDEF domain-containing protein n=1 Tax=Pseudomonas sp. URIL14HWK12:I5 TaxID=1261630 RepID=UPI0009D8203E|nr:sensor domain-containing diguanylate cyclase [Pseudomonas sp. URIL14HWK12:I5]SMD03783.1 diguanylate cyclase (GGDEF) domain-containing protein [Pseudomonas sp. URIL14HWK12:I5]
MEHHSTGRHGVSYASAQRRQRRDIPSIMRRVTLGVVLVWLAFVASLGVWIAQHLTAEELKTLAAGAEYEAQITGRVVDRLFTEMASVANMVARQSEVIQLAARYRHDPPGFAALTREERALNFTRDPLVRSVGDFMDRLSSDLHYARIYMNNLSDDTVTASNWAESFSIVGQIYTGRAYLIDALRTGSGAMFGIARLNKTPSYFVASRIDGADGKPLGSVTVKFDAPDIALYLTGRHTALIVNRQGRVTTASSERFMLRNVAALLPPDMSKAVDGDEEPGEPMDIRPMTGAAQADQWLIDGQPYLVRRQPLNDAHYQLLTLATLDHLQPMRQQYYWTAASVAALGLILILLSSRVTAQMLMRRQEERYAANYDALTGLKNRRAILAALHRHFALAKRTGQGVLVAFIDLDEFKAINDTYGHEVGDQFLIEGSRRLQGGLRATDELGRWGGDEFVVIGLTASVHPGEMAQTVSAMRRRLAPLLIGSYEFDECRFNYSGASIGITSVDPSATSLQAALKAADQLMYADKEVRRGLRGA